MVEASELSAEQIRKANLIQILSEDAEPADQAVTEPPDRAAFDWSEEQIRIYFKQNQARSCPTIPAAVCTSLTALDVNSNGRSFKPPRAIDVDTWFPGLQRSNFTCPYPRMRVLCFHNAGSAEDMYTNEGTGVRKAASPLLDWCRKNGADCLAVQLPGRGMRSKEPFLTSMQEAAQQLLPIIATRLVQTPYVVIAHSMGAWVAFEFLCHARSMGLPMPCKVFISAMPFPAIPFKERPWQQQATLHEREFQEECKQWNVSPTLFSPALWPVYHSIMRADFNLFDQYQFTHEGEAPFAFPLSTFYGSKDTRVTAEMVKSWQCFTTGPFSCGPIEGNHLWPLDKHAKVIWLQAIVHELDAMSFAASRD
ncbi:MAG: Oleoyl-(acyl-carrier-) hydrolase [Trebouxia sp. A1-2]|nr:MAG: Oleoyl-(acyl-carrier-) hydrolase [Trebouxia sp. A1-2]